MEEEDHGRPPEAPTGKRLGVLTLTALGVVYGDIGTSPLYALREAFHGEFGMELTPPNVLGVLSLMIWSLVLVISLKYLLVVMRADNDGEGGILALMELVAPGGDDESNKAWWVIPVGFFGAALLYGDGMITPAISVLSAIEGLEVATPVFEPYIIPITCVILVGLFILQSRGTQGVGVLFGPIMVLWFSTLGLLGVLGIVENPEVLRAFNPVLAVEFFARHGLGGILVLGAVFLVVTGGEALYADMGHLGTRPIRVGWFGLVLPGLLLNYLGQGALLIGSPEKAHNPFYLLAPDWATYPMVALATAATIIASQAVISGAFSLTMQSVQFGYLPRVHIRHTSEARFGQIYVPIVNWILLVATIGLVIGFQTSSGLAAAYGVAVSLTMIITDLLLFRVMRKMWKWAIAIIIGLTLAFLVIDVAYFSANAIKILSGGWFPLVVAAIIYLLMSTWQRGQEELHERIEEQLVPFSEFLDEVGVVGELETKDGDEEVFVESELDFERTAGQVVYLTGATSGVPRELVQNFRHNRTIHEMVVFLTVQTDRQAAHVALPDQIECKDLGNGFYRIIAHTGFMQEPDIPAILGHAKSSELPLDLDNLSFVFGKETILAEGNSEMARWRVRLFAFMERNSRRATAFFNLPRERVVEIGTQVEM